MNGDEKRQEKPPHSHDDGDDEQARMYVRFGAMIVTATAVMLALTYTNSYSIDHVRWSEERLYMALLMGACMALIMLGFMWHMHRDIRMNVGITVSAIVVALLALWLSRSQQFVDDRSYMSAMIPHHSIAILTSERADIDDVRVRELADEIAEAQRREIKEMKWLIDDIEENGKATTEEEAEQRPVPEFDASP